MARPDTIDPAKPLSKIAASATAKLCTLSHRKLMLEEKFRKYSLNLRFPVIYKAMIG